MMSNRRNLGEGDDRSARTPATPDRLLAAPGFVARRMYQAYVGLWQTALTSGLTGPQFAVLSVLEQWPGCEQSQVAAAAEIDPSTMAGVARRLERQYLIVRVAAEHDKRVKRIFLTSMGQETLDQARGEADRLHEQLFAEFSPARAEELKQALVVLSEAWTRLADTGQVALTSVGSGHNG